MVQGGHGEINQAKFELIEAGLPAELAIDFGPTFKPQYLNYCAKNGAGHSLAIAAHAADLDDGIDFHQADFSRDDIVPWVRQYRSEHPGKCLGISLDTLLHQYGPLHVLMNLLSVLDAACIGTPVLREKNGSAVFLPAVAEQEQEKLFPVDWMECELCTQEPRRFAAADSYGWGNWLWGLNENLLKIWIERQGFQIEEERLVGRPNAWDWYGCFAVRK